MPTSLQAAMWNGGASRSPAVPLPANLDHHPPTTPAARQSRRCARQDFEVVERDEQRGCAHLVEHELGRWRWCPAQRRRTQRRRTLAAASLALPVSPSRTVSPIFSSMCVMPAPM